MADKKGIPQTLIVPGYKGSGPGHWQSWLEGRLPGSRRLQGVDWHQPVLAHWAARVRDTLQHEAQPLWLVAHSFGCLAALTAAADLPGKVAGLILVAPAEPRRFDFLGLRDEAGPARAPSLEQALPTAPLGVTGLLLASRSDPFLRYERAEAFAQRWGLPLSDAGDAGHLNEQSGHGPWPDFLALLQDLMRRTPPVETPGPALLARGRGSLLASVRQHTRQQLERR